MRAFEFYAKKVFENVAVENTPKSIEGAIALNAALDKAIEVAKQKQNVTNKVKKITPSSQQNQPERLVASLDEAKQDYASLIAEAKKDLQVFEKLLPPGPESAKILASFNQKVAELNRLHDEEVKNAEFTQRKARRKKENPAIAELAGKVTGTLEAIEAHYKKQAEEAKGETGEEATEIIVKEAPPMDAVTKEIVTIMDGTLEGLRDNPETADDYNALNKKILQFLKASKKGVVPLAELLTKGSGNIIDEVDDGTWGMLKENGFIKSLMKMKPAGSGAGKWGPGEVGLAVLGSPVNKMGKGDLNVGGKKFELKASASPKSGGRINASKAIKKGSDGQGDFMKAWESFSPNLDIDQKGSEIIARKDDVLPAGGKRKIKVTSIGQTWVAIVNAALARSNVRESELGAFLQDVLRAPINDAYKNKVKFNNSRLITSNEEGRAQISGAGLLSEYIGECMKLYNETDGVEDILVINPSDGHFEIINALDNAGIESKIQSGAIQTSTTWIDFDDPQMLATPQLGTITPK